MYVITGATGQTGHVIAKTLLAAGKKVRVIGRDADRLQPLVAQGAQPFVADLSNSEALARALAGAQAVYTMIPPNPTSPDYRAYQDRVAEAVASALEMTRVKYAVNLSSIGAAETEKTGPVVGLHNFEQRLNRIAGLNVLHLRAGYFMENTLAQIGIVRSLSMAAGPLRGDLPLSMIATRDIGAAAAGALLKLNFQEQQTRELLGPGDVTMNEVADIIGQAIGKAGLAYRQLPDEQVRSAFVQMGMSLNGAGLILEMAQALNSKLMRPLEPRSDRNSTPTSYETFVVEEFVPRYQGKPAAA